MNTNKKRNLSLIMKFFVVLFSAVNIFILAYTSVVNKGFLFVLYCTFYVMIPGLILYYLLALPEVLTKLNCYLKVVLVFFLGIFLLFIQYYILKLAGCVSIIRFTVPVLAMLAAVYLIRHKKINLKIIRLNYGKLFVKGNMFVYTIFSIILLLVAIYTFLQNPAEEYLKDLDSIWHMGNINMLASNSFGDFRVLGAMFSYHYFSDLFLAICNIIFKMEPYNCVMGYPVFFVPFLMVFSVYGFFKMSLEKFSKWAVKAATVVLLFLPKVDVIFCNTFTFHFLTNVNAVSLALPCLLIILALVKLVLDSDEELGKKAFSKLLVLIFILQLLLSGLKGPFAVMVVGGMVLYFILSFRYKQSRIKNLLLLAVTAASFAIIYPLLLSKGSGSGLIILNIDNLFSVVPYTPIFNYYYNFIVSIIGNRLLAKLILLIPNYAIAAGIAGYVSVFAISIFIYRYIKGKKIPDIELFSYAFIIEGIGGYYLVEHVGHSQMYFLFAALPVVICISAKFLAERWPVSYIEVNVANFIKFSPAFIGILIIIISIVGNLSEHVKNIKYALDDSSYAMKGDRIYEDAYSASKGEIEGLEWVRANTNEIAVCATNKHYISSIKTDATALWFYDSAYSARQYSIEGYSGTVNSGYDISKCEEKVSENDKLFRNEYSNIFKYELAEKLGIDYLVIHKNEEKNCVPDGNLFTICFENEDIVIVKVGKTT